MGLLVSMHAQWRTSTADLMGIARMLSLLLRSQFQPVFGTQGNVLMGTLVARGHFPMPIGV